MDHIHTFGCFADDSPGQRQNAEDVLKELCMVVAIEPPRALKQRILGRLALAGDTLNLRRLPPADRYANHLSWLRAIQPFVPEQPVKGIYTRELRRDATWVQTLVIASVDLAEEIHYDFVESFLILDGNCICTAGEATFSLEPGDYLEIPCGIPHEIRLLGLSVTAILQYRLLQ